ncbi:MAG: hypothetical protein GMKNLPBB_02949 [Myxococcota bacterium]|nr:hypothetical protein [Myxococcota bacterium]
MLVNGHRAPDQPPAHAENRMLHERAPPEERRARVVAFVRIIVGEKQIGPRAFAHRERAVQRLAEMREDALILAEQLLIRIVLDQPFRQQRPLADDAHRQHILARQRRRRTQRVRMRMAILPHRHQIAAVMAAEPLRFFPPRIFRIAVNASLRAVPRFILSPGDAMRRNRLAIRPEIADRRWKNVVKSRGLEFAEIELLH